MFLFTISFKILEDSWNFGKSLFLKKKLTNFGTILGVGGQAMLRATTWEMSCWGQNNYYKVKEVYAEIAHFKDFKNPKAITMQATRQPSLVKEIESRTWESLRVPMCMAKSEVLNILIH